VDRSGRYADVKDILARKARGRRARARLKFSEKIAILEQLRKDARTVSLARQKRRVRPPA
jgi:hypothetical protein